MTTSISHQKAASAFRAILATLGRDAVEDLLCNWNDYELSEDGAKIICFVGRDRDYSRGKEGGKVTITRKEFLDWLLSDGPFDENAYGANIRSAAEWVTKIKQARNASGLLEESADL